MKCDIKGRQGISTLSMNPHIPERYICYRVEEDIEINGDINKGVWRDVPFTNNFVDIEGNDMR